MNLPHKKRKLAGATQDSGQVGVALPVLFWWVSRDASLGALGMPDLHIHPRGPRSRCCLACLIFSLFEPLTVIVARLH